MTSMQMLFPLDDEQDDKPILPQPIRDNFAALAAAPSSNDRKRRRLALETALAVESEMAKLQQGIAELEHLLQQANGDNNDAAPQAEGPQIPPFPYLPHVVLPDDAGEEETNALHPPPPPPPITLSNSDPQEPQEEQDEEEASDEVSCGGD